MKKQLLTSLLCITSFFQGLGQTTWRPVSESPSENPVSVPPLVWQDGEKLYFLSDKKSSGLYGNLSVSGTALTALSSEKAPEPRKEPVQWEEGGRLWLWGGVSEEGRLLSDLWMYSVLSQQWEEVHSTGAKPPAARGAASWTDTDGNLWMFGGKTDDLSLNVSGLTNTLWKWEKRQSKWTSHVPDNAPSPRTDMALWSVSSNKILIYGGVGYSEDGSRFGGLSDLWELNTSTLKWSARDSSPPPYEKSYGNKKHPGFRIKPVFWKGSDGSYHLAFGQSEISRNRISSDPVLWKLDPDTFQWDYVFIESDRIMITASRIISDRNGMLTLFFPTYVSKALHVYTQPSIYTLTKTQPSK